MRKFSTILNAVGVVSVTVWPQAREEHTMQDLGQLWNESCDQLRWSRKCVFGLMRGVSPAHGQVDGREVWQHACSSRHQKFLGMLSCLEKCVSRQFAQARNLIYFSHLPETAFLKPDGWSHPIHFCLLGVISHIITEHSLLGMSINNLSQRYVTDGPSSPRAKGRRWC